MHSDTTLAAPRWDGTNMLFDILVDGEVVACAISRLALETFSDGRCYKPADIMRCFTAARPTIEAAAIAKHHAQPDRVTARLVLWEADVEPPDEAPEEAAVPAAQT